MAYVKKTQKRKGSSGSRKPKYSAAERKAYWVGVGISAERHHDSDKLMDHANSKIRASVRSGYSDDNRNDVSSRKIK